MCYNDARRTEPPRQDYPGRLVKGSFHFSRAYTIPNKRHNRASLRSFSASLVSFFMQHVPPFYKRCFLYSPGGIPFRVLTSCL